MGLSSPHEWLKKIPKVDELLKDKEIESLKEEIPRSIIVKAIQKILDKIRKDILSESIKENDIAYFLSKGNIISWIKKEAKMMGTPRLKRVINATGIIVHTNLGRSPLAFEAINRIIEVSKGYSNLEYDLLEGRRGLRYSHVEPILTYLTGAEAAMVVNNNAAAVFLALNTFAKDKEVIISRGELIEIGGAFRIPDVMRQAGAILKEVGTTNRTHLFDYQKAITSNTGLLLKVHTSNYRILGFTSAVETKELVSLGKRFNIHVMEDLGSGNFIDFRDYGLSYEPTVQEVLRTGVDIVTFSGDKMLGGPQAGIIVGKEELIKEIGQNPITRAVRIDKLTLAALEATLTFYLEPKEAIKHIPTLKMILMDDKRIHNKARLLYKKIDPKIKAKFHVEIKKEFSQVGGGALPLLDLPTRVIVFHPTDISTEELDLQLRQATPPIIGRIKADEFLLDMRTIRDEEIKEIPQILSKIFLSR